MKKLVAFIVIACLLAFSVPLTLSAIALAEENFIELDTVVIDVDGDIVSVDVYGEALSFYGDGFTFGDKVHVVVENGRITDVVSYSFLEKPFGASSFFYANTAESTAE